MAVQHDINQQAPKSGRMIRENNQLINEADMLILSTGLIYALSNGEARILSCDVTAEAGETVGMNVWLNAKSVVSRVGAVHGSSQVVRKGLADGSAGEVCGSSSLNLLMSVEDGSQAQVVANASSDGLVLADGAVQDSIITNGTQPFCVLATNESSEAVTMSIFVTYYSLDNTTSLTLLQADTSLTPTTEMSDYGPN